jgi:hypothetical protein
MRLTSYLPGEELIPLPLSGSIPELPHVAEIGIPTARNAGLSVTASAPWPSGAGQGARAMVRAQMQAFVALGDAVLFNYRHQIGVMALRNRLPAASNLNKRVRGGGI